jgi:SAM-dependent methyltransferase
MDTLELEMGRLINGYWNTLTIHAAAQLGLADRLGDVPRPVAELARELAVDEDALYRLLRALAGIGLFSEARPRSFVLRPLGATLRTDAPGSMRGRALLPGGAHVRAWLELTHSVRTGETGMQRAFGCEIFPYLADHPDEARIFDDAMAGYTTQLAHELVRVYDFSRFRLAVDVGGGKGALLAVVLRANPPLRGVCFDVAYVAERARAHLAAEGVASRCDVAVGDFFDEVPAGGDVYLLSRIIHDWDDARATQLLKNVRRAIAPGGTLLVIDAVLEPGDEPSLGKMMDVNMLVMTGGRERTAEEFRALLGAAGFRLTRVLAAGSTASVVEATPA